MGLSRPNRLSIVHGVLVLFALALIAKAGYEQLYRGSYWTRIGARQHYAATGLPAPRGDIQDASGETLVESREVTRISVAPREVRDRAQLARVLSSAGVDARFVKMALDTKRKWVDIPGTFLPAEVAPIVNAHGVYAKPAMDRVYSTSAGIRRIVGRVGPDGRALDGVELSLDSILTGDTSTVRVARDKNGRPLAALPGTAEPKPGDTVVLTISRGLQDICDRALAEAVDSLHADGGDIVVMSPKTGEILAMSSNRADPAAVANTGITEPYEPGSTVKPLVAARLLLLGRAKPDEAINTFGGHLELNGRKIDDAEEHQSMLTLTQVIQHSSNVGIVEFGERLTPREKYELFRDAGFGEQTAVALPAESPGLLRDPSHWSKQSEASVSMGYELAVTPLQIVTAYSAIANGGELLEPHLIKEIRDADGTPRYTAHPKVVRRIMTPQVAAAIRAMLREVVTGGTGTKADLATFDVAGKSGTARRNVHGKYEAGQYTASFVGLFPEEDPQYVVLVKLDNPQNGYFGGVVAGSVTSVVLRAALAARDAALNVGELASSVHAPRPDTTAAGRAAEKTRLAEQKRADSAAAVADSVRKLAVAPPDTDPRTSESFVVKLPARTRTAPPASSPRAVPNVVGLPLRQAVRSLHAAGFRVELVRGAPPVPVPAVGTLLAGGRVVKLGVSE